MRDQKKKRKNEFSFFFGSSFFPAGRGSELSFLLSRARTRSLICCLLRRKRCRIVARRVSVPFPGWALSFSTSQQGRKTDVEKRRPRVAEKKNEEKRTPSISLLSHFSFLRRLICKSLPFSPAAAHHKQPWPPSLLPGKRDELQSAPLRKRERAKAPAKRRGALNSALS